MGVYDEQASKELMEKLAELEPEPVEARPAQMAKTASVRGQSAVSLLKVGQLLEASRRVGRLRAEAEIAELYKR